MPAAAAHGQLLLCPGQRGIETTAGGDVPQEDADECCVPFLGQGLPLLVSVIRDRTIRQGQFVQIGPLKVRLFGVFHFFFGGVFG